MRTQKDAKVMAKSLREVLAAKNVALSHSPLSRRVYSSWETRTVGRRFPGIRALGIERVPVIPLRDIVVYPGVVVPIFAGRTKTLRAVDEAMRADKHVLLVLQRLPHVSNPTADDLYNTGTLAQVLEESEFRKEPDPSIEGKFQTPDASVSSQRIVVKGFSRARVDMLYAEDYDSAHITVLNEERAQAPEDLQLVRTTVMERFERYTERTGWPPKAWNAPPRTELLRMFGGFDLIRFADTIAAHIPMPLSQKQEVLEMVDVRKRLEYLDDVTHKLE